MKFYPESGVLEVAGLVLMRHTNVPSLIEKSALEWDWGYGGEYGGLGRGRLVFDLLHSNGKKTETILLVNFNNENGEILCWKIGSTSLPEIESLGTRKRLKKAYKEWFEKETGVLLPVKKKWGKAYVSYDARSLTACVSGLYEEYRRYELSYATAQ
jgi:hypothetical protein